MRSICLLAILCQYKLKTTLQAQFATNFALAPNNYSTFDKIILDIAIAEDNKVILKNTQNPNDTYSYEPFNKKDTSVLFLDWNQVGIFAVSANQIKIHTVNTLSEILSLDFNQTISYAVTAIQKENSFIKIITAVAFVNRIQLYQNSVKIKILNITTKFQTMTLDSTGKYLYYFDGPTRYVFNIPNRSVQNRYTANYRQNYIAASSKYGFQDITVTIDELSHLCIWDDYSMMNYYSNISAATALVFTEDSNYLAVYISDYHNKLKIYKANYTSFASWLLSQQFEMTQTRDKGILDAQNNKIAILINNTIFLYEKDSDEYTAYVFFITFLCFCICGFVTFCYQNCRHKFSRLNWNLNNQNYNNIQVNQQSFKFNNPINNKSLQDQYAVDYHQGINQSYCSEQSNYMNPIYQQNQKPYIQNSYNQYKPPLSIPSINKQNPYGYDQSYDDK